jgi:chromate transporter
MIALMREQVLARGWLSEGALLDMIAVAESTPGPIAVNMATFVGSAKGGILGAAIATVGVVLPSFLIILLIASVMQKLMRYAPVKAFLGGLRPAVIGLILSTACLLLLGNLLGISSFAAFPSVDLRGLLILLLLIPAPFLSKKLFGLKPSPILLIALSAALGMLLYGVMGSPQSFFE